MQAWPSVILFLFFFHIMATCGLNFRIAWFLFEKKKNHTVGVFLPDSHVWGSFFTRFCPGAVPARLNARMEAERGHFERCRRFRHHVRRKRARGGRSQSNRTERPKPESRGRRSARLVLPTRANFSYMCRGRGGNWSQLQQCRLSLCRRRRTPSSKGFWWDGL